MRCGWLFALLDCLLWGGFLALGVCMGLALAKSYPPTEKALPQSKLPIPSLHDGEVTIFPNEVTVTKTYTPWVYHRVLRKAKKWSDWCKENSWKLNSAVLIEDMRPSESILYVPTDKRPEEVWPDLFVK